VTYQLPERRPSALAEAHQEIVDRAREHVEFVLGYCERSLMPVTVPTHLTDALRELDRLEGVMRDCEQAMDDCLEREREAGEVVPETISDPMIRESRGG